jgi:hypothetical protein
MSSTGLPTVMLVLPQAQTGTKSRELARFLPTSWG